MNLKHAIHKLALISNPIIWLKDYLTMSDADEGRELAGYDINYFTNWLRDYGSIDMSDEQLDMLNEEDFYDIDSLHLSNDVFEEFFESASSKLTAYADAPSFLFMNFESIIRNQWLIHFTDNAFSVSVEGFTSGIQDMQNLGLTVHLPSAVKQVGGYNFAYDIDDFERYGRSADGWKYGSEIVMFRASGIKVHHFGDEEPQVIFWGSSANSFVPITENDYGKWQVGERGGTGEPVFESDNIERVVGWVENNYSQYRRVL